MKKKHVLVLVILFMVFSMYSQNTNEKVILLTNVFGYLKGQQYYIDLIKANYPEYSSEAQIGEMEFNKNFSRSIYQINREIKVIYGNEYHSFIARFNKKLKVSFNAKDKLTEQNINSFINTLKERAKGQIESPVLETLLAYQYYDYPEMEMLDSFTKAYITTVYSKNKKLITQIELPVSWKEVDSKSTQALKKFRSIYGVGNELLSLELQSLKSLETSKGLKGILSDEQLKKMIVTHGKDVKIEDEIIGGIAFKKILYSEKNGSKKRFTTIYATIINSDLIKVKFTAYYAVNSYPVEIEKFNPLLSQILSSVKIYDKDKKTKMVTYNN